MDVFIEAAVGMACLIAVFLFAFSRIARLEKRVRQLEQKDAP